MPIRTKTSKRCYRPAHRQKCPQPKYTLAEQIARGNVIIVRNK